MLLRVFKKPDGTVIYQKPHLRFLGGYVRHKKRTKLIMSEEELDALILADKEFSRDDFEKLTLDHCNFHDSTEGLDYFDVEESEVPNPHSSKGEYFESLYIDGECRLENLKQDREWNQVLMPIFLIRKKHKARLDKKLDNLLEDQESDLREILKTQRLREKHLEYSDSDWYEQALKNLDDRVGEGESDKKTVRKKLKAKIKELKGE